jgi:hypothetical protein
MLSALVEMPKGIAKSPRAVISVIARVSSVSASAYTLSCVCRVPALKVTSHSVDPSQLVVAPA